MTEGDGLKHDVYSARHENAFDWDKWASYDKEWWIQLKMDIKEVRLMYSLVSFYLQNYSGAPGRPPEEQHYLPYLQQELYKMIQDYNLTHNTL